jgi:hypothetical protein
VGLLLRRGPKEPEDTPFEWARRAATTSFTPEEQANVEAHRKVWLEAFTSTSSEAWETVVKRLGDPRDLARLPGTNWALMFVDPIRRDNHLSLFDLDGLPLLRDRRLSLDDLTEIARRRQELVLLARTDLAPLPVLWRWLQDAARRRLIQPAEPTTAPTAETRWDLTEAGLRAARRDESVTVWLVRTARAHLNGVLVLLAGLVGLFGAAAVRHSISVVLPFLWFLGSALAALIVTDLYERWRARRRHLAPYERMKKAGLPTPVELGIWLEVTLQLVAIENPDFPRWWLDVDAGRSPNGAGPPDS